jgi:hypothetical protein
MIDIAALPRQQRRALEYLLAQPDQEYRTRKEVQDAIGSTMRGAGNVLQRLLEAGAVTCASNDNIEWLWRAVREQCNSKHIEGNRSWRCMREDRHRPPHINSAGGRRW